MTLQSEMRGSLAGRCILYGVCGSIAAYKAAVWVRSLMDEEARVNVVMTRAATRFIAPLTFAALTGNPVCSEMFDTDPEQAMAHITLAREADLILIAPATAQTIARIAHGMADDLLSTTVLAAECPVVICPAMNSGMYANKATQKNIQALHEFGYHVVEPGQGYLACGEVGPGRLADWEPVRERLLAAFSRQDLRGHRITITAGPTREPLDPARYLSNRSSGKMGYALARTARRRGAEVTLISGPVSLTPPPDVRIVPVTTAAEMYRAVMEEQELSTIFVKSAAVADFRPTARQGRKIKKSEVGSTLELILNEDILQALGNSKRPGQLLVGFAAESDNHLEEGLRKLHAKNVDLMVVNDILGKGTGFDVDTNQVTLIDRNGNTRLPLLSKEQTADRIWDRVVRMTAGG